MNTNVKILLGTILLFIVASSAMAIGPHTRFTHLNEYCIYYDGVKQCKLKDSYCDPAGNDMVVTLGLCDNLGEDVLLEPKLYDGKCPLVVMEGEKVEVEWEGTDPDSDIGPQGKLTYEFSGVLGEDGTWQTKKGDAGIHQAQAKVFDGEFWDETELCIEVLKSNTPSTVTGDKEVTVYEGETVKLTAKCSDADGDATTITYSGWMSSASKVTGYTDAGDYSVSVNCVDPDGEGNTMDVAVHVLNKNRPPKIIWKEK